MLYGEPANQNKTIAWIESSKEVEVYLTGSRFFGNRTEHSDWDIILDEENFDIIARELKFPMRCIKGYKGSEIEKVYTFDNVDFQIAKPGSLALLIEARDILKEMGPMFSHPGKEIRAHMWETVLSTIRFYRN